MLQIVNGYEVRICRCSHRKDIQVGIWELERHYFVDQAAAESYFQGLRPFCTSRFPIIQLRGCTFECDSEEVVDGAAQRVWDPYAGDVIKEMALTESGVEVY